MSDKNKGGRPKSYSDAQVDYAIEQAEDQGLVVGIDTVKPILCNEFGISSGINGQSLERTISERVEFREAQKAKDLLEKLPSGAKDAASELSEQFRQSLVGFLAQAYDELRAEAGARETETKEDLRNTRARVRDLEAELAAKADRVSELESKSLEINDHLEAKTREIADLRAQLEQQLRDAGKVAEMKEMLKQAVASLAQDVARTTPTNGG